MPDNVNHPAHYETNGIECIDAMVASQGIDSVMNYCLCNAFKYIWRCQHKGNCREDIQKAIWYLNKWNELAAKSVDDSEISFEDYKDMVFGSDLFAVKRGFENTTGIDVINATKYRGDNGLMRYEFTYLHDDSSWIYTYKCENDSDPDDWFAFGQMIGTKFLLNQTTSQIDRSL